LEELNRLLITNCNDPLMKRAAMFSALTGIRFCDIKKLKWQDIEYIQGEGYLLALMQKKTKNFDYLPISEQAMTFAGTPGEGHDFVFDGLKYSTYHNRFLFQWIGAAGITKHVTFHCFRHTFAVLQLSGGTDIYTLSKMMGHKELRSTQIYAKVVDRLKRAAADRIKLDIDNKNN